MNERLKELQVLADTELFKDSRFLVDALYDMGFRTKDLRYQYMIVEDRTTGKQYELELEESEFGITIERISE